MIYRELAGEEDFRFPGACSPGYENCAVELHTAHLPALNMQLVSQQFRQEFLTEVMKHSSLTFEDTPYHVLRREDRMTLAPVLHLVPHVDLSLMLCCSGHTGGMNDPDTGCAVAERLNVHSNHSLGVLTRMTGPKKVAISLYMFSHHKDAPARECQSQLVKFQSTLLSKIATIIHVTSITVYSCVEDDTIGDNQVHWNFLEANKKVLLMTHSHEQRQLVDVIMEEAAD